MFAVRDTLPADDAELAALLQECPLTLVSLGQLSDAAAPGADATDDGTVPTAREAACSEVDAAVGRLRAATDALPGETLLLLQGISEVNGGRPQLHVGLAHGPRHGRRLAHLGQHRAGAVHPAHRRRPDGAAGPGPATSPRP